MTVYLLHFDRPIGEPQSTEGRAKNGLAPRKGSYQGHAQHYIGYTRNLEHRLRAHRAGRGGHLCRVAVACGIEIRLARVWEDGTRKDESRLKRMKSGPALCPICSGEAAYNRGVLGGEEQSDV